MNAEKWTPTERGLWVAVILIWVGVGSLMAASDWTPHIASDVYIQESADDTGLYWFTSTANIPSTPSASILHDISEGKFLMDSDLAIQSITPRIEFNASGGLTAGEVSYLTQTATASLDIYAGFSGSETYSLRLQGLDGSGLYDYILCGGSTYNGGVCHFPNFVFFDSAFNGVGGGYTGEVKVERAGALRAYYTDDTTDSPEENWSVYTDGKMYWGGGGSSQDTNIYRSAANELTTDDSFVVGTDLTVDNDATVTADLAVDGEFTDARQTIFIATEDTNINSDRYLSPANDSAAGWVASRSGVVVGIGGGCRVSGIPAGSPTFDIEVRKNASATILLQVAGLSGTGSGWVDGSTTQTRAAAVSGSDTFSANDTLKCYIDLNIGGGEAEQLDYCTCAIDVQLDS